MITGVSPPPPRAGHAWAQRPGKESTGLVEGLKGWEEPLGRLRPPISQAVSSRGGGARRAGAGPGGERCRQARAAGATFWTHAQAFVTFPLKHTKESAFISLPSPAFFVCLFLSPLLFNPAPRSG